MTRTPLLTLCIHGTFREEFQRENAAALSALGKQVAFELLSWEVAADLRCVHTGDYGYNQALMLLWRHAKGELLLNVDASSVLIPEALAAICRSMARGKALAATALRLEAEEIAAEFEERGDLGGLLMQREAACRHVRVTEAGLLSNWGALAQIKAAGEIFESGEAFVQARRPDKQAGEWHFTVRNAFFESNQPKRYLAQVALYDTTTLERYLADAEQFLLRWPDFVGLSVEERKKRIFAKRRNLYLAAREQALADGEATLALHYLLRARVCDADEVQANPLALADFSNTRLQPLRDSVIATADAAIAEQIRIFRAILGEGTQLYVEEHAALKQVAEYIADEPMTWLPRDVLQAKPPQADELIVFYESASLRARTATAEIQPGRQLSIEQLNAWLCGPLHGML